MSTTVVLENEAACLESMNSLRDNDKPETWVLWGHVNHDPNLVKLVGSGSGALSEMVDAISEDNVHYGLYRTTEKFDMTTNIKFVYIYFVGDNVPALKRGKIGVVKGDVKNYFEYHVSIETSKTSDITEEAVAALLAKNSGKVDNVKDYVVDFREQGVQERGFGAYSPKPPGERESKFKYQGTNATKHMSDLPVSDELKEAIEGVRSNENPLEWVIAGFENNDVKKQVIMLNSGTGSVDAMMASTADDLICFALVRVIDVVDGHPTTKFAFIFFIGPSVSVMKKGKITPMRGSVTSLFSPYHVDFDVATTNEISDDIIKDKVCVTSGTKSKVK